MPWKVIILTLLTVHCQSCRCPAPLQDPVHSEPDNWDIRIFTYGDSRTGFFLFENQDNRGQKVHEWLVGEMIKRAGDEKVSIVFTGDAVYAGGSKPHWDNFVKIVKPLGEANFKYLPAVGNHELYAWWFGLFAPKAAQMQALGLSALQSKNILSDSDRDKWEELFEERDQYISLNPKETGSREEKRLDRRNKKASKKILPNIDIIIQSLEVTTVAESSANVMREIYVELLGFKYLEEYFKGTKAYYSQVIKNENEDQSVKLIILDTNTLNDSDQKDWFENEIEDKTPDVVIVYGHHPPTIDMKWDWLRPYLTGEKSSRAVLWIFAHQHNYEHYFKTDSSGAIERAMS